MGKTTNISILVLVFVSFFLSACMTLPMEKEDIAVDEIGTTTITETEKPPTSTPTLTPTSTKTLTPTVTLTPTYTATSIPTLDPEVGPAIIVVSPDEDPEKLALFLDEAIQRGYVISDFDNFMLSERPIIIIFDNLKASSVTKNQERLIETMESYGKGILAVIVDTKGGEGAKFIYNLSTNEGWPLCVQGSRTYTDLSLEDTWIMSQALGWFQGIGEDHVYKTGIPEGFPGGPTLGNYPSCVVPLNGDYSQALVNYMLEVFNPWIIQHPEVARGGAIDVIVSSDKRMTYDNIEIYPSVRELNLALLPY